MYTTILLSLRSDADRRPVKCSGVEIPVRDSARFASFPQATVASTNGANQLGGIDPTLVGVAPEDLDGVSPLEAVLRVTIIRDMDPELVDAEYTTDDPEEADELLEMLLLPA